jgi:KipI family sensor histidine kinase inhibitor
MSVEEVVRTHTAPEYTAAFLGFQPGFAYLVGGDERLQVPRRDEPRQRVPEGSVAVAGPYSGVYPREGPGGWQLLGTTTAVLFDPDARPPALLAAGDRVRFVAE